MKHSIFLLLLAALPALAAELTSVKVVPASLAVGATTRHEIRFTSATAIPCSGSIVVTYPNGFTLGPTSVIQQTAMDGTLAATVSSQVVTITRNDDGTPTLAGTEVSLVLSKITNHATAAGYTVTVETRDSEGATLDGPTTSGTFTLE